MDTEVPLGTAVRAQADHCSHMQQTPEVGSDLILTSQQETEGPGGGQVAPRGVC